MANSTDEVHASFARIYDQVNRTALKLDMVGDRIHKIAEVSSKWSASFGMKEASGFFDKMKQGLTQSKETLEEITQQLLGAEREAYDDMLQAIKKGDILGSKMAAERYTAVQHESKSHEAIYRVKVASEKLDLRQVATVRVVYGMLKDTYATYSELNASLIGADSERLSLAQSLLQVQRETGVGLKATSEAAAALVNRGYDLDDRFKATTKTVVQMKEALGVSVDAASELAAIAERRLGTSFRGMADAVARTVHDTGLAGTKAVDLATQLAKSASIFRKGFTDELPRVTEVILRLEGALQELGGETGAFSGLLTRLTTLEGMASAGVLGVQSPDFMKSEQATKQVIDSFANYAKQTVGDSRGWERVLRLEALAQQFGTTAQQADQMMQALERNEKRLERRTDLEAMFDEQMEASGKGLSQLKESLGALMKEALAPAIAVFNVLVGIINKGVQAVNSFKGVATVLTGVIGIGMVAVTARLTVGMYGLAKAMASAAVTSSFLEKSLTGKGGGMMNLAEMFKGQGFKNMGSGLGAGLKGAIGPAFALSLGPVVAILGALSAGAIVGLGLQRRMAAYFDKLSQPTAQLTTRGAEGMEGALRRRIMRETTEGVLTRESLNDIQGKARSHFKTQGLGGARLEDAVAKFLEKGVQVAGDARYMSEMNRSATGFTEREKNQNDRNLQSLKAIEHVATGQKIATEKMAEEQREARRQGREVEGDINKQMILNRGKFGFTDYLKWASTGQATPAY